MDLPGDIIPPTVSRKDIQDEVNRRTAKAGYTTRLGECPYRTKVMATVNFGKEKLNVWPRDPATGELLDLKSQ